MPCSVIGLGAYGREEKWTLRLAIRPGGVVAFELVRDAGTTIADFVGLVDKANAHLNLVAPNVPHTLMWDNLSSHLNAAVSNAAEGAGHRCIARPPYRPCDAPIEYVFNQVEQQLTKAMYRVKTDAEFIHEVQAIISNLGTFDATFLHCGYQ